MNYQKIYNQLVNKRKQDPILSTEYSENHHIIPSCIGGPDTKENKVRLSAREHYIAHHLLWRIHRTSKLAHAWWNMLMTSGNQERYYTSRQYEMARQAHIEALKKDMKGSGNPFYGRTHTEETKRKIGQKNSQQEWSEERRKKHSLALRGIKKTPEWKSKIGRKGLVMLKNIKTEECVRIPKEDLTKYDKAIWKNPSAINQKRETCKYCGIESVVGNIKRWHNEKCKHKPNTSALE